MSATADRARRIAVAAVVAAAVALVGAAVQADAAGAGEAPASLVVTDQTFAVTAGSQLTLDLELTGAPSVLDAVAAATTTTTTTTTTSTPSTTSTSSTTTEPASAPGAASTSTVAAGGAPSAGTTVADAQGFAAPGGTAPPSDGGTVTVTIHDPLDDVDDLDDVDGGDPGDAVDTTAMPLDLAVDTDAGSATGTVTVRVTLDEEASGTALDAGRSGIHPLTVDVEIAGEVIASTATYVLVTAPDDVPTPNFPIALLATVDDPGPWATDEALAAAARELQQVVDVAAATNAPLTVSIPPSVARPAATTASGGVATTSGDDQTDATDVVVDTEPDAAAGDSAPTGTTTAGAADGSVPPAADDVSRRLAEQLIGDQLLARPLVPLDPSAIVGIGRTRLFTEQLRAGEEMLAAASPQATPSRSVWFAAEPLSQGGADALRDLGVQLVVVPADVAAAMGAEADVFALSLADGSTLPGIVISSLGDRLATPSADVSPNDAAVRLLVEALLVRDTTDTPALVLAPGEGIGDAAVTAAFARHAASSPGVNVVPASHIIGSVGAAARDDVLPAGVEPAVDLTERAAAIDAASEAADAARSMLTDPRPAATWDRDFVRLLSTTVDDDTASRRLSAIEAEIDSYLDAIVPPERFTFRITGTSSDLPLRIVNNSDQVLNVVVRVASPKLETEDLEQALTPGENLVKVPVTARSNGTFSVEVSVLTPSDVPLARPVVLKADVTGLSGLSRVVTIGALLALASWWYRHFRKRRRTGRDDGAGSVRLEPGPTLSPDAAESRGPD